MPSLKSLRAYETLAPVLVPHRKERTVILLARLGRLQAKINRLGIEELNGDGRHLFTGYDTWRADLTKKLDLAESQFADLTKKLPHTKSGPIRADFSGDPRGSVASLILPGESGRLAHNSFARDKFIFPAPTRKRR